MALRLLVVALAFTCSPILGAALTRTLLVPEKAVAGRPLEINVAVLNPSSGEARVECPDFLKVVVRSGTVSAPVEFRMVTQAQSVVAPGAFVYVTYRGILPEGIEGEVIVEDSKDLSLRSLVQVSKPPVALVSNTAGSEEETTPAPLSLEGKEAAVSQFRRSFTDRFSTHMPIYFIAGLDKPAAKFQISFKYRILGDKSSLGSQYPSLRSLYFGYTQRSLWDITSNSSPFYDTSYMPELMFEDLAKRKEGRFLQWLGYQVGAQHESNGRDGLSSRSMNIAYVRPMIALGHAGDWALVLAPKFLMDIDNLSDNPDLRRYRGYAEYLLMITKNDGPSLTALGRVGSRWDRGSIQLDLNYPVKVEFGSIATFVLVQYFDGYGESLLNYNKRSRTVRLGFSLVR